MHENPSHAACVDAWLQAASPSGPLAPAELVSLFERGLLAVWREARESLGEVTLFAITTRVVYVSAERFPILSGLRVGDEGVSLGSLRERVPAMKSADVLEPLRFLMIELLRILGELTAHVLTPWLHAELGKVRPTPATCVQATADDDDPAQPANAGSREDEKT